MSALRWATDSLNLKTCKLSNKNHQAFLLSKEDEQQGWRRSSVKECENSFDWMLQVFNQSKKIKIGSLSSLFQKDTKRSKANF